MQRIPYYKLEHQRVYQKIEEHIADTRFGFRIELGTREALFSLQGLTQRCRDVNYDGHLCFIDFKKAFDRAQHDKMIQKAIIKVKDHLKV